MSDETETEDDPKAFERFQRLAQRIVRVPKSEVDKRAEEWKAARKTGKSDESEE